MRLALVLGLLALAAPAAAQRTIPLVIESEGASRALVSVRLWRGERVICEHDVGPELDALPCGEGVHLPGPGTYVAEIDVIPTAEEPRSYRYRLPIARDATAATLVLAVGQSPSPDTAWLGGIWLDVERPGAPDGVTIEDGRLHASRPVLWRCGRYRTELRIDGVWTSAAAYPGCLQRTEWGGVLAVGRRRSAELPHGTEPGCCCSSGGERIELGRAPPPDRVRVLVPVHRIRARGRWAEAPEARPTLRRTDRRWLVREVSHWPSLLGP